MVQARALRHPGAEWKKKKPAGAAPQGPHLAPLSPLHDIPLAKTPTVMMTSHILHCCLSCGQGQAKLPCRWCTDACVRENVVALSLFMEPRSTILMTEAFSMCWRPLVTNIAVVMAGVDNSEAVDFVEFPLVYPILWREKCGEWVRDRKWLYMCLDMSHFHGSQASSRWMLFIINGSK